jgi:2-dehydro-3-deoxygalactonokinase
MNPVIFVDTGTTNSRVWLMKENEILARAEAMVGVRDTAREGNNDRLKAALHDLMAEVQLTHKASAVIAAGMITSALGLAEIPHLSAPVGIEELAKNTRAFSFPEITDLPFYLVTGVRSGAANCTPENVNEVDLMRGEETLCFGLREEFPAPFSVLNLGSHWKVIQVDAVGRVVSSVTTISGELIYATQTQTILASAVPHEKPDFIDYDWATAGMREQQNSGLARALFCVRLLEQKSECTPQQRLSFLIGAYVASDFSGFTKSQVLKNEQKILITGSGEIGKFWERILNESGFSARIVTQQETEVAFLSGLRSCFRAIETASI